MRVLGENSIGHSNNLAVVPNAVLLDGKVDGRESGSCFVFQPVIPYSCMHRLEAAKGLSRQGRK
jgi:hypothetical protein